MVSRRFYKVLRRLFFNAHLRGLENLGGAGPFIFVSNHAGAFGPVSVITSMPFDIYPWVAHEVTDLRTAAPRIQAEFVEPELRLRPPLSVCRREGDRLGVRGDHEGHQGDPRVPEEQAGLRPR